MPLALRELRYFLVLAEELHFGRAAERLHLAQPALSQAIKRLEQSLGVTLLDRTSRRVRLTAAGEALLPEARLTVAHADQLLATAKRLSRSHDEVVRVGFVSVLASRFMPQLVRAFAEREPRLELRVAELTKTAQLEALEAGELDVALLYTVGPDGVSANGFTDEALREEPVHVALPAAHPLASRESLQLSELGNDPLVTLGPGSDVDGPGRLLEYVRSRGFEPRVIQEATNLQSCLGLVAGGLGVALAPAIAAADGHEGVAFVPVRDAPELTLHAVLAPEAGAGARSLLGVVRELAHAGA